MEPGADWEQLELGGCNDTVTDRRGVPESELTTSGICKWYEFDVTSLVGEWFGGSVAKNDVLLRQSVYSCAAAFRFASSPRGSEDRRPVLAITYRAATGGSAAPEAAGGDLQPVLTGANSDSVTRLDLQPWDRLSGRALSLLRFRDGLTVDRALLKR